MQKERYQNNRIRNAITYIEKNLKEKLTLTKIARYACYSKYHFIRIFHASTGETVSDYIRKRRISESAIKLVTTNDSILHIALQYQFESQQAYTRSFKSIYRNKSWTL
ncbi:helix-turn-helix domain-containing protein [Aquimarina sp. RZ0]|uniref:AraC family transcriptional regulator n=1 Tax=Aquimarina sp. RZ0 TaxID=2607730 RepID=UPI0011F18A54|nr:helix-turn-helix domain-containing protein [Aquimarina sp. RZ0]KAA1245467.1 helix-turn-helix domain-containing protein [Aquimarina sp. RZ0]